ncbi:hypothetical protein BKA70DRAFT_1242860, partial [Coprinopsis sp. MPI-PUGE-AT-0042]
MSNRYNDGGDIEMVTMVWERPWAGTSLYEREIQPSDQRKGKKASSTRKPKARIDGKPNHPTRKLEAHMDGKPKPYDQRAMENARDLVSCEESQGSYGRETQPYDQRDGKPNHTTRDGRRRAWGQRRPASFPSILDGLVGRSVQALSVSSYERESQSYKVWWRGWLLIRREAARMDGKPNHTTEMGEEKEEERPIAATLNPRLTNPIKTPTRLGSVSQRLFHLPSTAWLDAPSKPRVPPHMSGKPNHTTRDGCIEKIVI